MGYPYPNFCLCAFFGALDPSLSSFRPQTANLREHEAASTVGVQGLEFLKRIYRVRLGDL